MSGIYEIRNVLNNHRYIGSTVNIDKRWKEHINDLNAGRHHSAYLQNAWNKYGESRFEFNVLEECEAIKDTLLMIEQKYLDLDPEYNICKNAHNTMGVVFTEERKRKIGEANKNRIVTDITRRKLSEASKKSSWNEKQRKAVLMIDPESLEIIKEFISMADAGRYTGHINHRVNIKRVLQGKGIIAYGYKWKLKEGSYDI